MCNVEIRTVVGVDTNGDNERDEIIVVGVVEDCPGVQVALFSTQPPADAQISDGIAARAGTILPVGDSAHGVSPTGGERVFTAAFTLFDTTLFKGRCGDPVAATMGILAVCDNDNQCRDALVWDQPIVCGRADCPVVSVTVDVSDECVGQTRSVSLSIVANPFSAGLAADLDFGDGSPISSVVFSELNVGGGVIIGQAAASHTYAAPGPGATDVQVVVAITGLAECTTTVDISVSACPGRPPGECPVERVTLEVEDPNGNSVADQLEDGGCLAPGQYVVRAVVVPPGAAAAFAWSVDGFPAIVGQNGVVAINGARLTIDLAAFRSVSVIAAGCASDGVDLRPCEEECCPDLDGLQSTCMTRCPPSTTVTLTATGSDLECAEVFAWEFGDGTTSETLAPSETHTYANRGRFNAAVSIVRSQECGPPRTQRRTATVEPCPPSCFCLFLAVASAFLLLAFLSLMPMVACASDPATSQALIVAMIIVAVLLVIFMLWWLLDPCCRPTECELLRIFYWVFSWALVVIGIITIMGFCVSAIPFGVAYVIAQQVFQRRINDRGCDPAPDIFSWPFPACR